MKEDLERLLGKWAHYCNTFEEHCNNDTHSTNDLIAVVLMCHNDLTDVMNKHYSPKQTRTKEEPCTQ